MVSVEVLMRSPHGLAFGSPARDARPSGTGIAGDGLCAPFRGQPDWLGWRRSDGDPYRRQGDLKYTTLVG